MELKLVYLYIFIWSTVFLVNLLFAFDGFVTFGHSEDKARQRDATFTPNHTLTPSR